MAQKAVMMDFYRLIENGDIPNVLATTTPSSLIFCSEKTAAFYAL
jgi:hypothetical protein